MKARTLVLLCMMLGAVARPAGAQSPLDGDPLDRLDAARYGPGTLIAAMEALDEYRPDQAVEPVRALLGHPVSDVARTAGWLLRRMEAASGSVPVAAAVLADLEAVPERRASAAVALAALRSAGGMDPLVGALGQDPDEAVRRAAARGLGTLSRPGAAGALATAMRSDESAAVRQAAARALVGLSDADPGDLVAALADEEAAVRMEAAWSLGRMRAVIAVGNLIGHLQSDADCRARAAAAWALGQIGDTNALDALRQARESSCRAAALAASAALSRFP